MAKKFKLARFLQEIHGYAEVTNRRPSPPPPWIFLMQLRQQQAQFSSRPQARAIPTAWQEGPDVALPIRIHHLDPW